MRTLKSVGDVEAELRRMDKLRQEKRKLEAELDESKEAVKAYMDKAQLTSFATGNCSATISKGKKKRFDKTAFSLQHPRMYEQYLKEEEYSQLYFKVR